jgi:hypothetical protein
VNGFAVCPRVFAESALQNDFGVFPLIIAIIGRFETAARRLLKSIRDNRAQRGMRA